jgi:hypothetical protein
MEIVNGNIMGGVYSINSTKFPASEHVTLASLG